MNGLTKKKKQSEFDGFSLMRRLSEHFHQRPIATDLAHDLAPAVAAPRPARPQTSSAKQSNRDPEASPGPQPVSTSAAAGRKSQRPTASGPSAHAGAFKL
jgi:hypothetical protein